MDEPPAPGVFDTLLMPLRLPGRVVADIETLTQAVVALQRDSAQRLASVDDNAAELVERVGTLLEAVDRIDGRVADLQSLETTIEAKMEQLRDDLNTRMLAVEHEIRGMLPPMEQMAQDVSKIDDLLPSPSDGPLAKLKDTLTSSGG